ncbi:chemotaxis protein CheX [Balneolales bacterium ANBcel1]|nr:chemotaxis protein CheX [Balneolales bacterium ANBcel1]
MTTKTTYADDIYKIAIETFELMCYMFPLDESEFPEDAQHNLDRYVTSAARFDGAAEGGLVISACEGLMDALAENMLGTDDATDSQKEGALCEIVNIICGNVAPFFSKDDKICYIRPPEIIPDRENPEQRFEGMNHETVMVHLDEGCAKITVYYS